MNVTLCVDALQPQLSGIGRYTWELCNRLAGCEDISRVNFYAGHGLVDDPATLLRPEQHRRKRFRRLSRWMNKRRTEKALHSSLVHGPNYFLPLGVESGIITIHDLSVFRYPETHPADRLRDFERQFESSLRRAAHVITDSETVRREVVADFGLSEASVTVAHLGVAGDFRPRTATELEPELTTIGLRTGEYALCVSTLEPRKKIAELIRAWHELPDEIRNSTPLVLAGATGWLNDQLHNEIRGGVAAGWLKHVGYVPDALLPTLYAGAALFLYPSTYEGFGLPPLEAMASGVPVLVANQSCLPEICGDAAGYVDPDDVTSMSDAIVRALMETSWRIKARQRGLERAAGFSWEKCAAKTVSIYGSVLQ